MTKFEFNPHTGQFEMAPNPPAPSAKAVFDKVKRVHGRLVAHIGMTDDEINHVIAQVKSGTRNSHYLGTSGKRHEQRVIINFILRELGN